MKYNPNTKYNPDHECQNLIHNIRQLCKEKNLKMNKLAERAELSVSTISEILNGRSNPQVYTLFKICNALECSEY